MHGSALARDPVPERVIAPPSWSATCADAPAAGHLRSGFAVRMLVRSAHRLVTSVPPRSLSRAALMCPWVTDRRPSFGHAERIDPDRRLHRLVAARLRRDEPQHRPSTGHLPHAWGPVPGAGPADITRRLRPCRPRRHRGRSAVSGLPGRALARGARGLARRGPSRRRSGRSGRECAG